jgi:hypothetical protein
MSEYPGTETVPSTSTGTDADTPDLGPTVLPDTAPTPSEEDYAKARALLARQATEQRAAGNPVASQEQLGQALLDGGAGPQAGLTGADADSLMASIKAMQAQIAQLTALKDPSGVHPLVKYANALHGHLEAKSHAHPAIRDDPDWNYVPGLELTSALKDAAGVAASSGDGAEVVKLADQAGRWIGKHARRFAGQDYSYVQELAGTVADEALKLAA